MINFVNLLNSKDARWILNLDEFEWPEKYDGEDLKPIVEKIMLEDETLSGNMYYSNYIEDEDYKAREESKIIAYTTFQTFLTADFIDYAEEVKKAWRFKVNTWEEANNKVLNIQQKLKIHAMKNSSESNKGDTKLNYGAMIANLVYHLKITPYLMTVAQFRAHELQVKQLTAKK